MLKVRRTLVRRREETKVSITGLDFSVAKRREGRKTGCTWLARTLKRRAATKIQH
jgi:hypothetical protein